ncbi:universal stress protein [Oceanisphaera arctica]|uniref:Universal stress protein n=1 Tax=Oceanisphaera arctica TaxID=641510 RepID=A0A2P5TQ19_9GAMM|nr:universal stress protein [Oceanisphaera arctica]PPL17821.1 universal stress protein [Oceanisphaera arctica]GHA23266.1 universal stress protein YxiE [Oceanisphaera arctica]
MYKSLLVAVDGSEHSKKALTLACHLARQDDAVIHILHVPEVLPHEATLIWGIGAVAIGDELKEMSAAGKKVIAGAEAEARKLGATNVQTHVARGEPARAIIQESKSLGVDVIVMGCRGLGDLAGLMMGSVSHKVSHSAKCGVITVR